MNQSFLHQFNQIPDEHLIQICMMNPLMFKGLCFYLAIELQVEKENAEFQTYRNQIKDLKSIMENQGFALGLACREVLNKTGAFVMD